MVLAYRGDLAILWYNQISYVLLLTLIIALTSIFLSLYKEKAACLLLSSKLPFAFIDNR